MGAGVVTFLETVGGSTANGSQLQWSGIACFLLVESGPSRRYDTFRLVCRGALQAAAGGVAFSAAMQVRDREPALRLIHVRSQ
jgi:hypothetical protein